jgi:ribosomal protein S18 acetylase RimI-like enzyme
VPSDASFNIVRAEPSQSEELTRLAYVSKAHWNYPETWLTVWRERGVLEVSSTFITETPTFAAFSDKECVGFYSLVVQGDKGVLEHLFIKPAFMGQGFGQQLFEHALVTARGMKVTWLELESDPNAQAFYEKMGMTKMSDRKSELLGIERSLPLMGMRL